MTRAAAVNAILLDDSNEDRAAFQRLEKYGLPCQAIPPPPLSRVEEEVVSPVNDGTYDLVLVDYLLDQEAAVPGQSVAYRGSTPAALLKDRCPHVPVVLVTTDDRYRDYLAQRSELGALFDFVVSKSQVRTEQDRGVVAEKLQDLAMGFRQLRSIVEGKPAEARWMYFREALMATEGELDGLRSEWPNDLPGTASELARWLLKGLLKYPGPLRDRAETAVMLGVTEVAMGEEGMREWTTAAKYAGVFARIHERWWSGRLLDALEETLGKATLGPPGERAAAVVEKTGVRASCLARCSWCDQPTVHRICSICRAPVDATHHLQVRHAQRPEWALPGVVCFRCIESGEDEDAAVRYSAGTTDLIEDLRTGRLRGG